MGFWIFMLSCDLIVPFTMILFGIIFRKRPPAGINGYYGYRSSMSMKNTETWEFAHRYFGKIWLKWGKLLLLLTVLAMLPVLGKEIDTIGFFGGSIAWIECIFMIIPVILTEIALRKRFDKTGKRK